MKINDPSLWPYDLSPFRFEPATGEFDGAGELTLTGSNGTKLASLVPLLGNECALSVDGGHDTTIAIPAGSWEITVYDDAGAVIDIRVLTRGDALDDDERGLPAGVRTWALLTVLWSRWPTESGRGGA